MIRCLPWTVACLATTTTVAAADHAGPVLAPEQPTYAVVVGSNDAGPGQTDLKYAEDDARRMGRVLVELGGYRPDAVTVIVHPSPDQLRSQLDQVQARVAADQSAGRKPRVFFYYSGHARSTALDLGDAQMSLPELRTRLFSMPAALTVVVLDACQSGAFSRVKGATPAADFSFNSRSQLDAIGVAVLASSSGSELSQESEELRSSYFTHHLLVGMRGAADANRDGQVSIDEAYRYAYHQTLLATTETAVGGQHVSLEVDLKGHGEVPVSFPRAATAAIILPATLEGRTLVHDKRSKTVVAETYKAKGATVRIAVAPGDYEVLVRRDKNLSRCQLGAGPDGAIVDLGRCTTEALVTSTGKGGGYTPLTRIELVALLGSERRDTYTDTLGTFGYDPEFLDLRAGAALVVTRRTGKRLWIGGTAQWLPTNEWRRIDTDTRQSIEWTTTNLMATARGVVSGSERGIGSVFSAYAHASAGLAIVRSRFDGADGDVTTDTFFGPAASAGAGFIVGSPGWPHGWARPIPVAATLGYELTWARALHNELGEHHASGGHSITLSLSYSY